MTTAEELQQVLQKFSRSRSLDVVLQLQVGNSAA
jgi:hypothetical protein